MPNTGVIEGKDVLLYYSPDEGATWTPFAHATSHSLSRKLGTRERVSKDTGTWTGRVPVLLDWSVSMEALKTYDGEGYNKLEEMQNDRERVKVKLAGRTEGDGVVNPEAEGDYYREGFGYITQLDDSNPNNEDSTYSLTIEADGKLVTKQVPAPQA